MILRAFLLALGQIGDRRFLGVLVRGVGLTILLFAGLCAGLAAMIGWAAPQMATLPWVGQIAHLHAILGLGGLLLVIGLSVFLMVPVAALFTGFFLDTVAHAVEDRHYPALPPVAPVPWGDAVISSVNFFGMLVAVNIVALLAYLLLGPLAPMLFWAVNGYLIGREYFELAATRRIGRVAGRALRRQNRGTIWLAGMLMAAPLSVPFVNLLIPVLGAATFTHIFHALSDPDRFRA